MLEMQNLKPTSSTVSFLDLGLLHHFARLVVSGTPESELKAILEQLTPALIEAAVAPTEDHHAYGRNLLLADGTLEVMLARWRPYTTCALHDHGFSKGSVFILRGEFKERHFDWNDNGLQMKGVDAVQAGSIVPVAQNDVHSMECVDGVGLTLHVYSPPISNMKVFDPASKTVFVVTNDCGAWVPKPEQIVAKESWKGQANAQGNCNLILYTTKYRGGGDKFKRAAETQLAALNAAAQNTTNLIYAVESKKEFLAAFEAVKARGLLIDQFHFYGHSGVYGIMFGSTAWPEQFSPFEWKSMSLPITSFSEFYFHSCRSGRWFAPFISRTLNVKAFGYRDYTTVSKSPKRFVWERKKTKDQEPVYIIACPGKKSHGYLASVKKYLGLAKADAFEVYENSNVVDSTYNEVADFYEQTFEDIVVRKDELNWLTAKLTEAKPNRVLDLGCGNGAFLDKLSPLFQQGVGVDLSVGMLEQAKKSRGQNGKLSFRPIAGPILPFEDNSFDVVMSTLAFRYLDWDPMMSEILRVLKPGGKFIVLDMVTESVGIKEVIPLLVSKLKHYWQRVKYPKYFAALKKMVNSPQWRKMLKYNPIRSQHEMKWYLESRFKGQKMEVINVGLHSRIVAFDTGPVTEKLVEKLQYP